ncbi:ABC transporter permease [Micromonospora noduli]|uniref:Ribose transport system permease protein RbsC n=1 Tax=Micromonospora noduli TaxID=709876 RepID=A0A328MWA8_9ACTN|nr:ABC transporter permease [Micromonospora noduli]KAB1923080.1 ABC transporter permease [Micromonospora noduli]RAN92289.1 Ribose transport system permease protein RbsC [Micromonospora noduli]RAO11089.1 Ribose transport system permease protein RbsC [Micromonospora noduli]RAO13031.1 Ribose transport system permease protein RbsC [Micromonospora noduli]RAO15725.1 Ribose transport system permease protein RbsC [Micromonospora noduli]
MSDATPTPTATPERPQLPAQSPPVDPAETAVAGNKAGSGGKLSWWRGDGGDGAKRNLGLIGVLAALIVVGAITKPDLYGDPNWVWNNVLAILQLASVVGVVTVGMTFVIIGGGIDLSVGAIVALAGVWCTTVATQSYGAGGMIFAALAVGICVGLVNGVLISYGRLVPFIATLAMLVAARGLAASISNKQTQVSSSTFINDIAARKVIGIPILVYILGAVVLAGWVVLNRTTFGRRTIAVGGNPEAARLAGINVRRHTMLLYALSGLCCGIAAIMLTSQATSAQAAMANLYELDAIAAAIIGGTLLSGGRGTIVGSLLGVIIFATITNLFAINGLSIEAQNMVKGGIIVAAVLVQQFQFKSVTRLLARNRVTTAT